MTACPVSWALSFDPEAELLERLRAGEEAAFAELVRTCGARLLATARRMLPSEDDARDAVQDAFLAAFRALPRFAGTSRLSTWLHRIVINAALMKLRTRRRRPEASLEDLLPRFDDHGTWSAPLAAMPPLGDAAIESRETRAVVQRCIRQLPTRHRIVLVLRDLEDLDIEATARALQLTTSAVKTRHHRARQALRTLLLREMARADGAGLPHGADGAA
jgi:RNA polymerase sigma-70 factor (ECF subfamily)